MELTITYHAKKRAKERCGLKACSIDRIAIRAFSDGKRHSDFSGSFKRYLDKVYLSHRNASNIRIYGNIIFIFCGNTLLTVLDTPSGYRKK